jgi:hypothetical protein
MPPSFTVSPDPGMRICLEQFASPTQPAGGAMRTDHERHGHQVKTLNLRME